MYPARKRLIASVALAAFALAALPAAAHAAPLSPEPGHSPNADDSTIAYWVMLAIAAALVVAVNAALIVAVVRFRSRRGREPARFRAGRRIQPRVAAGFAVLAAAVFVFAIVMTTRVSDVDPSGPEGLKASSARTAQLDLSLPSEGGEPLRILASGQQWLWRYQYPDGAFTYHELVVPVDTTVQLQLESTDVVHRWWIPELGGKFDAVPGRGNQTWFRADEEGVYEGQSAAFSGTGYATMRARVRAVPVPEYQTWLEQQADDIQAAQDAVQRRVEKLAGAEAAAAVEEAGG